MSKLLVNSTVGGKFIETVDGAQAKATKAKDDAIIFARDEIIQSSRITSTLSEGVSVVNGVTNALASVEVEGQTLVSLGNSNLEAGKKYVIADKKTKIIVDTVTYSGVAKFSKTGVTERATVIRVENFEGKTMGSVAENSHVAKTYGANALLAPSNASWAEHTQGNYDKFKTLDSSPVVSSTNTNTNIAQQLFSFNLIEAVERNIGRIPRTTVVDKVEWLKANVTRLVANWHGFGSSPTGNKASLSSWVSNAWALPVTHVSGTVSRLGFFILDTNATTKPTNAIHADGFVHFLAYAEPSDGTTLSRINTDYIDLEIELKPDADFTHPKVPLYEVTDADYAKILVDWNADEVVRRFPNVEGIQHLQGVGVFAEGDNLLPPFMEWTLHANAKIISPYELELNATGANQATGSPLIPVIQSTQYTLFRTGMHARIDYVDKSGVFKVLRDYTLSNPLVLNVPVDAVALKIYLSNAGSGTGVYKSEQPILAVGEIAKPFVPRNPSSIIADVKLGAIGDKKDILYEQDGRWLLRENVKKDVELDGSLDWVYSIDFVGYKRFRTNQAIGGLKPFSVVDVVQKFDGKILKSMSSNVSNNNDEYYGASDQFAYLTVADIDTGFGETGTPTALDIKRYFNGWKYSNGTTWTSVTGNGQTVTAQVALDTKPTDYTPYKLSYVLSTPQTIDVTDKVEGAIKINGLTQVDVMSGVVVREKVTPKILANDYYINNSSNVPLSKLKYKTMSILSIFKNQVRDYSWIVQTTTNSNGLQQAKIPANDFDPTAEYTVTYIVLDKHLFTANPTKVKMTYATNIASSVSDLVTKVEDNTTNISVHEYALDYIEAKTDNVRVDLVTHQDKLATRTTSGHVKIPASSGLNISASGEVSVDNTLVPTKTEFNTANNLIKEHIDNDYYLKHIGYGVTAGVVNAYTVTLTPPLTAYKEGVSFRIKIPLGLSNTGAVKLNVNGLGEMFLLSQDGVALKSGDLKQLSIYTVVCGGAYFLLQGKGGVSFDAKDLIISINNILGM